MFAVSIWLPPSATSNMHRITRTITQVHTHPNRLSRMLGHTHKSSSYSYNTIPSSRNRQSLSLPILARSFIASVHSQFVFFFTSLTPDFSEWVVAVLILLVFWWAARRETNFVLLLVIPPKGFGAIPFSIIMRRPSSRYMCKQSCTASLQ